MFPMGNVNNMNGSPLSTLLRNKLFPKRNIPSDKHFDAMKEKESLAEYVERIRLEKKMSYADVANNSQGGIKRTHVYRIAKGEVKRPSAKALQGLAKGLGVSEEELFTIARGKSPSEDPNFTKSEFYLMWQDFQGLKPTGKRDFLIYWNMAKDGMKRVKGES